MYEPYGHYEWGTKFGNFLGSKITAVKTDLAKCTWLDQFLLQ